MNQPYPASPNTIVTLDGKHFVGDGPSLVAEISDLQLKRVPDKFMLTDWPRIGEQSLFSYTNRDTNEGDTMGWWFRNASGTKLLIIND